MPCIALAKQSARVPHHAAPRTRFSQAEQRIGACTHKHKALALTAHMPQLQVPMTSCQWACVIKANTTQTHR